MLTGLLPIMVPNQQPSAIDEGINQGKPMSAVNGNAQTIIEEREHHTVVLKPRRAANNSIKPVAPPLSESEVTQLFQDRTLLKHDKTQLFPGRQDLTLVTDQAMPFHTIISKNHRSMVSESDKGLTLIDDKTRILPSSQPTQISIDANPDADRDLLTRINLSHHSNHVGLLAARELLQKALEDKGKILNNRFVLESVLGLGGMGVVYLTRDLRRVEAEDPFPYVATKVLNDDFKNHPDAFVALQQEAVKSQMLSHPNIVTVYDFDRDGDTLYMTMELLRGNPLDRLIKQHYHHGMPLHEAITIFDGLCEGLSFAHKNNLIHSDFKPMNVFITFGQIAKILDFGIARACTDNDLKFSKFDAGNLGAITPEYASLEMIQKKKPQFSDDVFALACVFYLTLSGKHPYNKVPANKALTKKLKPERIKCLSNSQWKALEKGLTLERKHRFQSVDEFNKAFHQTPWYTVKLNVAVAALSAVVMTAGLLLGLV